MRASLQRISVTGTITAALGASLIVLLARAFLAANSERATALQPVALVALPPPPIPPPPAPELKKPDEARISPEQMSSDQEAIIGAPTDSPPGPGGGPVTGDGALGLAEAGEGGVDVFGLAGKPGGRELLLTAPGGGGSLNSPARFVQYADHVQAHVEKALNQFENLRRPCYTAEVLLRLGPAGDVKEVRIHKSTGQAALDAQILGAFREIAPMDIAPPNDMIWPVGLRLASRQTGCEHRPAVTPP